MGEDRIAKRKIEAWVASLGSPNTRSAYRGDLAVFLAWCQARGLPVLAATGDTVTHFRDALVAEGTSEMTAKRRASAVHSFLRFHRPAADTDTSTADGTSPTAELSPAHRAALLTRLRDLAPKAQVLLSMLMLDGLKLDEVLGFDANDISGDAPHLDVTVTRDDAEQRLLLHPTTSQVVAAHLASRTSGPLLTGRRDDGARLTRFGADYLVKQAGRAAGLHMPLTTNMLRRSYVSDAHAAGADLEHIRRQVGHDDVRTTRRYLSRHPRRTNPAHTEEQPP